GYRAQHILYSAVAAEGATGAASVGRVGQRDALCTQPAESGNSRAHGGGFRAPSAANFSDRRGRHADGTAAEAQVFLPRALRNESRRAAFDADSAHEGLRRTGSRSGRWRGALFAGSE